MSWSVGFATNGGESTHLYDDVTFPEGMRKLHAYVVGEMEASDESESEEWQTLIADISDIKDDPGIMDDPDQWEDEEFWVNDGHYYITQD
jgi:hypothetical protein